MATQLAEGEPLLTKSCPLPDTDRFQKFSVTSERRTSQSWQTRQPEQCDLRAGDGKCYSKPRDPTILQY